MKMFLIEQTAKKVQFKTQSNLKEVLPRNLMFPVMEILILWRAQMLSKSPMRHRGVQMIWFKPLLKHNFLFNLGKTLKIKLRT